jgi:hypothetical protein
VYSSFWQGNSGWENESEKDFDGNAVFGCTASGVGGTKFVARGTCDGNPGNASHWLERDKFTPRETPAEARETRTPQNTDAPLVKTA